MRELHDAQSIIEAAKQAAAANDYIAAEALLRRAVRAQEAALGPRHPDLASTVNNLGIVCEINDKPVDAEACFRRAFTIATHTLAPDDPMVATSRQNLRDFCDARGKPFELPSSPEATTSLPEATSPEVTISPEVTASPPERTAPEVTTSSPEGTTPEVTTSPPEGTTPEVTTSPKVTTTSQHVTVVSKTHMAVPVHRTPQPPSRALVRQVQPRARKRSTGALVMGTLGPGLMLIVILAARPWLGSTEGRESFPAPAGRPAAAPETPQPVVSPPDPIPVVADKTPAIESPEPKPADNPGTEPTTARPPTVVRAQLCAALEDWHCDPPDRPIPGGQLFFYTQVKSASGTTVQHRWYQGDRLQHVVDLRVEASPTGYRSFSRYTMTGANAGNWKVELRTGDGVLLQEERFSVK